MVYTKERKTNNYIGILGNQQLPELRDTEDWLKEFYGEITLEPRPVEYAQVDIEDQDA